VDLIDEQDTWNDLSSTFFSPFGNFLVDLFSNLWFDLTDITSEKGHETLSSRVDNINFVKGDSMNNFFSLLEFTFWALNVSGLWSRVIEITASCERSSKFWNFTWSFINSDDISRQNFFFLDRLDHFLS